MRSISSLLPLFLLAIPRAQSPEYTSSSVADATEQLTARRPHMTGEIHLLSGARITGPAVTMLLVRDEKASLIQAGQTAIKLLESAAEGSVVVAALDEDKSYAVFGSNLAALAQTRKLAGFVIDGSVRDLPDLRRMDFPIFARGLAPGSAGGHYRIDGVNVPIHCGGIEVSPGDFVVADEDGVAVVPKDRLEEVLKAARKIQSDKQALLPLIRKDGSYMKALQEKRAAEKQQ
jgi:regulator of RNase E activity RraA